MRVLVVHNFYRSENASGENLSVRDEIAGLRSRGCDVEVLSADSDAISDGHIPLPELALRPIYSSRSVSRTGDAIRRFRPDVALVENLFPLHSPAVIRTLHRAGIPVAAGVRSYRMWCSKSSMFRDGAECRECLGSAFNFPAIRHGCYQQRSLATVPMAIGLAVHRPTWRMVDRFLPVSNFVRRELIGFGIDPRRITVRDNFVPDRPPASMRGEGFLYAGRLTDDKGIGLLADAWKLSEVWRTTRLVVAGSGPLEHLVRGAPPHLRIDALGMVPHERMADVFASTAVVVIPSLWHEPFGRGVVEAASMARPALVTDRGGLPELVDDGLTGWVSAASVTSMSAALRAAADPAEQVRRGSAARALFEERFTEQRSLDVLIDALEHLVSRR